MKRDLWEVKNAASVTQGGAVAALVDEVVVLVALLSLALQLAISPCAPKKRVIGVEIGAEALKDVVDEGALHARAVREGQSSYHLHQGRAKVIKYRKYH